MVVAVGVEMGVVGLDIIGLEVAVGSTGAWAGLAQALKAISDKPRAIIERKRFTVIDPYLRIVGLQHDDCAE